jgi:molybdenum cofactor cytidylyltransferase
MNISAIVLAAGRSVRMGRQKLLLPWSDTTVLGKVVQTLQNAGVADMIIVTNSETANSISDLKLPVTLNDDGEMLASIQCGLRAIKPSAEAALICLGDQPQIEEGSARRVCEAFEKTGAHLVVPSYQMKRGHPWLAARPIWSEILAMEEGQSMRGFMKAHSNEIHYAILDTPTILQDLDTPEDYLKYKPGL